MLIIRGGLRMKNRIYSYIIVLLLVFLTIYVKGRFFYGEDKQKREPSKNVWNIFSTCFLYKIRTKKQEILKKIKRGN